MYVCICNKITQTDLDKNPLLAKVVGTHCGKCTSDGADIGFDGVKESSMDNSLDSVTVK